MTTWLAVPLSVWMAAQATAAPVPEHTTSPIAVRSDGGVLSLGAFAGEVDAARLGSVAVRGTRPSELQAAGSPARIVPNVAGPVVVTSPVR